MGQPKSYPKLTILKQDIKLLNIIKDCPKNNLPHNFEGFHEEFVRRFSQHILPKRFVRISPGGVPHYGILSSMWKRSKLWELQLKLGLTPVPKVVKGLRLNICPYCQKGKMVTIVTFDSRGPPVEYVQLLNLLPSSKA